MEKDSDSASFLPPLAPYPRSNVGSALPPQEWQACLEAWILGVEIRLRLSSEHFKQLGGPNDATGNTFLESYLAQAALRNSAEHISSLNELESKLKRDCFLFARRVVLDCSSERDFFPKGSFHFLSDFCQAYGSSNLMRGICESAWQNEILAVKKETEKAKTATISCLSSGNPFDSVKQADLLRRLNALLEYIPEVGVILMTGVDFLDCLDGAYRHAQGLVSPDINLLKRVVATLYRSLKALTIATPPQGSLLVDQIFALKTLHEQCAKARPGSPTLLSDLVCSTPFLNQFQSFLAASSQKRGNALLETLQSVQAHAMYLFHPRARRKAQSESKGKARAIAEADDDMHIHSLTLVSQVQELFPDLPATYILRLLSHFHDNVEAVTAALLEPSSLPSSLQQPLVEESQTMEQDPEVPRPRAVSPLIASGRRNIFDNDDFSKLRISPSQLLFGKKDATTAEHVPTSERSNQKAAILSALAAFDSDSDERDDTYDVADVGGTVDTSLPGTNDAEAQTTRKEEQQIAQQRDKVEEVLFRSWKSDQGLFSRDTKTRLSQPRTALKREIGWTDEQIEGWAIMLDRDSGKAKSLEKKFGMSSLEAQAPSQPQIRRTAWRTSNTETDEETEADDVPGPSNSVRGRGHGRGRVYGGRNASNVAGPANDHATQLARRRKEQGKGRRGGGNHGRREGRAKKIARGFGGGAS